MVQLSHPHMITGKIIALTRQTFVGKVMSLLFNMLSRMVIMGNRWGNSGNSVRLYFLGTPKSLQMVIKAMKLKEACSLEEKI